MLRTLSACRVDTRVDARLPRAGAFPIRLSPATINSHARSAASSKSGVSRPGIPNNSARRIFGKLQPRTLMVLRARRQPDPVIPRRFTPVAQNQNNPATAARFFVTRVIRPAY